MRKSTWAMAAGLAGAGLLAAGCQLTRAGYASAPYRTLHRDGGYEVRDYPALRLVETRTGGGDFMRLFRYIDQRNEAGRKIAMTTPVFMQPGRPAGETMAFVLPEDLPTPPAPLDDAVRLTELPPQRVAVLRFRGRRESSGEVTTRLREWISRQGLTAAGAPLVGYFDPPWIPGFLRRNEVMIPTRPDALPAR
ncbi:MAG: SOUL family heme-binding protein [Verrucomicrobiota bacterium]